MQTATNPQTGEKVQWDGSNWVPVQQSAPAPTIYRTQPKQAAPVNQLQVNADQRAERSADLSEQLAGITIAKEQAKLDQDTEERKKLDSARAATAASLRKTIAEFNQIEKDTKGDYFETGTTGNIARAIPVVANDAKGLSARLVGLKGQNAFAALQELAAQGVKLTPISNAEIDLAASSVANLDPTQSEDVFLGQLDKARTFYQDALNKLEPGQAPPDDDGDKKDDTELVAGPVGSYVTDDDKAFHAKLQGMFDGNASKEQLLQFIEQNGYSDKYQLGNLEDAIAYRDGTGRYKNQGPRSGAGFGVPSSGEQTATEKVISTVADSPVGAYAVGAANGITLGGLDEVAGAIGGEGAGERAQFAKETLRENNPIASLTGELAGAAMGFKGLGGLSSGAARAAATKTGATATGATYGALDSNENRLLGGLAGGAVARYAPSALSAAGKALKPGAQRISNAFTSRLPNKADAAQEVAENAFIVKAGADEGIPVRQPDVRPSLRDQYSGIESSKTGGPEIQKAVSDDSQAIANRLTEIAGGGTPKEGYNLGSGIQSAVADEKDALRRGASALYRRVDMQAPGFAAKPTQTSKIVDDKIEGIKALTPDGNEGQISLLNQIKGNLEKTGLSVETLQANRDIIRQRMKKDNLSFTKQEVDLLEVLDAAAGELESSLEASGNEAATQTLKRANQKWREYVEFKTTITKTLVGNNQRQVSPEDAARRVLSMVKAGGDSDKFARVYKTLPEGEKADLRALIAEGLGKNTKDEFGLNYLAKNLTEKKTNLKTLREVFGPDDYRSLMNLKTLARAKTDAQSGFNRSNTTRAANNSGDGFRGFVKGALGFSVGDVPGAVLAVGAPTLIDRIGAKRATKMLLDTDFSKWLVDMPATASPRKIDRYMSKLDKMYPQGSVMASNVLVFKDFLRATAESPGKLAAQDGGEEPPVIK